LALEMYSLPEKKTETEILEQSPVLFLILSEDSCKCRISEGNVKFVNESVINLGIN
jgi:hypothetical protein